MNKADQVDAVAMKNKLSLHRFHKTLVADGLNFNTFDELAMTMYKMGISPVGTLKDYLKKYKDIDIHVMYVNAKKFGLHELPEKMDHERPTILVYMQEGWGEIINTSVKYYPAIGTVPHTKYPLINFSSVTLK